LDLNFQPNFVDIEEGEHRSGLLFVVTSAERKTDALTDGAAVAAATAAKANEILCLKVASATSAKSLAGAIANRVREGGTQINMTAIGPTSVNQAIKAIAIAREYLAKDNQDVYCHPMFMDVQRGTEDTVTSSCILMEVFPKARDVVVVVDPTQQTTNI
jgi:stage V sporulation protein S